jgi:hypothetical protein
VTTYGARGTGDLAPEQMPRSRKMRGRAQPYRRRRRDRLLGPSLAAMLRGAPEFLPNPADARRARQAALKRRYGRGISG